MARQTETMEINGVDQAITLDLTLTSKPVEGGVEVQCIVALGSKVARQPSKPLENNNVELTANNEPWCVIMTDTKGSGRAIRVFEYGTYDIRARLVNTMLSVREVSTAIAPEKKPPTKLVVNVHPQGHAIEYRLLIEAVSEKGGVPNWPVVVLEHGTASNLPPRTYTDKHGATVYYVETESPCQVVVSLLGAGLTSIINLKGPLPSIVQSVDKALSTTLPTLPVKR